MDFSRCVHLCVDMQRMFAEDTDWHVDALADVLPAVEALTAPHPARTVFTRFIPPAKAEEASGSWQGYYQAWPNMLRERLAPEMIELVPSLQRFVPPARVIDKAVYSPWWSGSLHQRLQAEGINTLVITGGETEVCVLSTVMGAIDLGYHVVLPKDAVCSSAAETHVAMLSIYDSRFGIQLTACTTQEVLDQWRS
ncbi:MAG: isochorismatase hydrolase [Devosia sp.]|nr:isochorismatase hydrolase [Devosia sp.]